MSSKWELDDGIKSIKSAWQREHTARANIEKMLENAEAENAKLRELCWCLFEWERVGGTSRDWRELQDCARELGVDV